MAERCTHEVIIAGAGPAGVATAVALVRAAPSLRRRIVVLDRARFPRGKPCGGGLTGRVDHALAQLGLVLSVPSFPSPEAVIRYGARTRQVTLPRPVRVVRREALDASLVQQARALGIEIREGDAMRGFSVEDSAGDAGDASDGGSGRGAVVVQARSGTLRAKVLVGADGAGSLVRKRLLGFSPSSDGNAPHKAMPMRLFRAELRAPAGRPPLDRMVYDFTPMLDGLRGYLWLFPVPGGLINVGLMHDPRDAAQSMSGAELTRLLRARLGEYGVELGDAPLRGWPAWGYAPAAPVSAPRLLTVGDAAGIDALTGEGIAVALEHGLLAGAAIARAFSTGDFRFAGYRRAVRRAEVGRDLALDRWVAALLYGRDHRRFLSLLVDDDEVLALYAARVSGEVILADRKPELVRAFLRHLLRLPSRIRSLRAAERGHTLPA